MKASTLLRGAHVLAEALVQDVQALTQAFRGVVELLSLGGLLLEVALLGGARLILALVAAREPPLGLARGASSLRVLCLVFGIGRHWCRPPFNFRVSPDSDYIIAYLVKMSRVLHVIVYSCY